MILDTQAFEPETKTNASPSQPAFEQKWHQSLAAFDPISLDESASARLMKRTDTKYVFPSHSLPAILDHLQPVYRVLEVDGVRLQHYQTLYFDTPHFQIYHDLIADSVLAETDAATTLRSKAAFEASVQDLIDQVNSRYEAVQDYLSQ